MLDLSQLIERYHGASETMAFHIRNAQQSICAANLIGQTILKHPDFQRMPAEMQEKFGASQNMASAALKSFPGKN